MSVAAGPAALAATGVDADGAVIFVSALVCVLVGLIAWGVGTGRAGGDR